MKRNLVIVESPAKARTIEKFLGKKYKVIASVGHVRDLPKSMIGIDFENNYNPKYVTIRGKGDIIKNLKKEAKKADTVYLATDPDREGEAISWHISNLLDIDNEDKVRVEFHEITKEIVQNAINNPRKINMDLVDAQQARRILDRIVGYKISPLLWKKIRKGLSAGRVQSVAVKIICDREKEIEAFVPKEYWTIDIDLEKDKKIFSSNFAGILENGKEKKVELFSKEDVDRIVESLEKNEFVVDKITKGKKKRNPHAAFTTSTLQQEASKKLGFSSKRTMQIAQTLYEGVKIDKNETVGLITYMRTDSIRLSKESVDLCKTYICEKFGEKYSNGGNPYSKSKKKEAQDAHEAIRPTSVLREPTGIKDYLTSDQYKLYLMIWNRFLASQMSSATYETITILILNGEYLFKSTGSVQSFPGFLKIYNDGEDNKSDDSTILSLLKKNDILNKKDLNSEQHFTKPPARFTEASMIKLLEELGIGRPSTFAQTIGVILNRGYVKIEQKAFHPTELGILVNTMLEEYFKDIINEKFTADMETELDDIAEGERKWYEVVDSFYMNFIKSLEIAEEQMVKIEQEDEVTDIICEKCGRNMVIKNGRYGQFLACPGYPECKNTKAIVEKTGVKCRKCDGEIIIRKTKSGKEFYGCSNYPECNYMSWDEPYGEKCPVCNSDMVIKKRRKEKFIICENPECKHKIKL